MIDHIGLRTARLESALASFSIYVAFQAPSRAAVDALYAAALDILRSQS